MSDKSLSTAITSVKGLVDGLQRYDIPSSAVCGLQNHHTGVAYNGRVVKVNLPNSGHSQQVNDSLIKRL